MPTSKASIVIKQYATLCSSLIMNSWELNVESRNKEIIRKQAKDIP